jgi:chemotaxis protein MotB
MVPVEEPPSGGAPEWVVTYGDMMSLLLTFFVLLFSMSEIKQDQSMALLEALRKQFGDAAAMVSPVPGRMPPLNSAMRTLTSMGRARRLSTMNGGDKVRAPVGDNPRVWAIRPSGDSTLGGTVYFPQGSATLSDEDKQTLRQAAEIIAGKPQKIEIRGHTATGPLRPGSPYRSHWDLAYARCVAVMDCLVQLGVDPERIRIGVAADNEPVATGPDPALRKQNDRVEVLMLDELTEGLKPTKKENEPKQAVGQAESAGT